MMASITKVIALIFLVSLVTASIIYPSSALSFLMHIIIVLFLIAATIRGLYLWAELSIPRNYAMQGLACGGLLMIVTWFFPIPVAVIVWIFDIQGPFGDIMLMSTPFLILLPIIGAGIGTLIPRSPYSDEKKP
jgi:hypothetical protein